MNSTQLEFAARRGGKTQCEKVLGLLTARRGQWVPMPELVAASGSYVVHSRIADLRKAGHRIGQKLERVEGQAHSFYKLVDGDEVEHVPAQHSITPSLHSQP